MKEEEGGGGEFWYRYSQLDEERPFTKSTTPSSSRDTDEKRAGNAGQPTAGNVWMAEWL